MSTLTVTKPLKKVWRIGGQEAREIELREATVKDLIAAEKEANPSLSPNEFTVALACETMVRAGTFNGPFTPGHFNTMTADTFQQVREAMAETSKLGED